MARPDVHFSPASLAAVLERLILDPPSMWNDEKRAQLDSAVIYRYQGFPPFAVMAAQYLTDLTDSSQTLVKLVQRVGPRGTATVQAAKDTLASAETRDFNYEQIASVLLFMAIYRNGQEYNAENFVAALREHRTGQRIDWQDVVHAFDRNMLGVTKPQFLALYNALLPIARDSDKFDIQLLWGGVWKHSRTQLSFLVSFLSCTPEELDASQIPRLRPALTAEHFESAPEDIKAAAEQYLRHPFVSADATTALFHLAFRTQEAYAVAKHLDIPGSVINDHTDKFVVSTVGVPGPWSDTQSDAVNQVFLPFFLKQLPDYRFVLYAVWQQNANWVGRQFQDFYRKGPMALTLIWDHAEQFGWLDSLIHGPHDFCIDLACQAHARGLLDIDGWLQQTYEKVGPPFQQILFRFLYERTRQESTTPQDDPSQPTLSLSVKTVHIMLGFLAEAELPDHELVPLQRLCIATYPRLINYGEGVDDIIDQNGQKGNRLPPEADEQMQDHFKKMYGGKSEVRDIIKALRKYKDSRDPAEQDLFACMIHGLFDEYNCFGEYPLEALALTAVLFGGIIQCNLLSRTALQVGLAMVLEAVQVSEPGSSMYKFGLQALLHFQNRLPEWPRYCEQLSLVPGLQGTDVFPRVQEVVASQLNDDFSGVIQNGDRIMNGSAMGDSVQQSEPSAPKFSCLWVDPPLQPDIYEDPDEEVQDKVRFDLNNISERNVQEKTKDLSKAVEPKHHQWFAGYIVEERARAEPKNQWLYLQMLDIFDDKMLWAEVLRETYVAVIRMLNSDGQLNQTERNHLKALGSWLGSLTIARDRPIKFRNISFKDLLIEGYQTDRLLLVIPFTCKVLLEAAKSTVFKWPNPWLVDIVRVLMELYHCANLKLNQKFEIEVLCKGLDIDHKTIEPSDTIRTAPQNEDEFLAAPHEGLEPFSDLSIMQLTRPRLQSERFSSAAITATLPDLSSQLVYPPAGNSGVAPARLKQIFLTAVQQAINEIIAPVVERSVTIASISTQQLITKDFAMEPDEEKMLSAAHNTVKTLSGSLALVTCKEPLRMSIMNNIRVMARELPEQALPEGHVLMFVNDNIDLVCSQVERAAEVHSVNEIDLQLDDSLRNRRLYRNSRPTNEPFKDVQAISTWAAIIPEPYRLNPGGLNRDQLAIYEEFGKPLRGPPHATNASQDSGRQMPDVLQDHLGAVSNLPTPSVPAADPRQGTQPNRAAPNQAHMNGFLEGNVPDRPQRNVEEVWNDLMAAASETQEKTFDDLPPASPIHVLFLELRVAVRTSPDVENLAFKIALTVMNRMLHEQLSRLETALCARLLADLCQMSQQTARNVLGWLGSIEEDEQFFNPLVMSSLLEVGLMDIHRLDTIVAVAIEKRQLPAVELLSALMDDILLGEHPMALRADFAHSINALTMWLLEDPDLEAGKELMGKLQVSPTEQTLTPPPSASNDQYSYIFDEWVNLQFSYASKMTTAAFLYQLDQAKVMDSTEKTISFLRSCMDASVDAFDFEFHYPQAGNLDKATVKVDALGKMIVSLVAYRGEQNEDATADKAAYLDGLLTAIILVLTHHQEERKENFNPRAFCRLFSTILFEINDAAKESASISKSDLFLVVAKAFLVLQPVSFNTFAFQWVSLVAHRIFMAVMLDTKQAVETKDERWDTYAQLMEILLRFTGQLLKSNPVTHDTQVFYRGVLRTLLVIHHDWPEFLMENHFRFCNSIPMHCTQLRNLIVSAYPSTVQDMPDPFTVGLKVDRLEDFRDSPVIRGDIEGMLVKAGIKNLIDSALKSADPKPDAVEKIWDASNYDEPKPAGSGPYEAMADANLIHAMVLYIATKDLASQGANGPAFNPNSSAAKLLSYGRQARTEVKSYLISAIANQLRWPNAHTHYFSYVLLHLFGSPSQEENALEMQEVITRVLLERLLVHRPHPWGLIVTLLELLKNQATYNFWDLPFVKAAPEVRILSWLLGFEKHPANTS